MANCGCNVNPCGCSTSNSTSEDETGKPNTKCDRDRKDNVWVEGADADGNGGICLLDTMEEYQVIQSLHRSQRSHDDLLRVTSDARLRELAVTVPIYPQEVEGDQLQTKVNENTIPFYSLFRGQPPFAQ